MYSASFDRVRQSVEALRRHLATSEALRAVIYEGFPSCTATPSCISASGLTVNAPDRLDWRVIDHCAAVTRVYAIYEMFAHEMLREHLALLQQHISFADLPAELLNSYRAGLAVILTKKDGPRYGHLDLPSLIQQYSEGLNGRSYALEPLALLIQDQNLRIPELNRLYANCGVSNAAAWIDAHRAVKGFFEVGGRLASSAEHEMAELVKYRNEAAHGTINVDELLGLDYLYEFCDFVDALCAALGERAQLAGIDCLAAVGGATEHGRVSECLKHGLVLVAQVTGKFAVGDRVYLVGETYCFERNILNLQIDDIDYQEVTLDNPGEVGFLLDHPGRNHARLMTISR